MGCKIAKSKTPPITETDKVDGGSTSPPVISRDEYNDKHEGARNPGHNLPDPPPVPDPNGNFKSKAEEEVLKVVSVDLKVAENAKAHHTDRYEMTQTRKAATSPNSHSEHEQPDIEPCLVVRRGQPFDISMKFDRIFNKQKDDIKLIFDFGDNPRESRGTQVILVLSEEDEPKNWGAKILDQNGETFAIRIFTPPHIPIAKWQFSFDTVLRLDEKCEVFRYTHSDPIYILFNPWIIDDQVFMSDEESRNEYVLNDCGRIFYGTKFQIDCMPWNFGQFEDFVLDVSMHVLDISGLNSSLRGNPVHVVRKVSALTNEPDDNGILVGNWSGDYSDGTSPVVWNGSVAILEEYWKTRKPVRYGQCWVFSAVVATICRCLGIPSRCVTNFVSAHDCDGSLTIDEYWDASGKPLEEYNQDSVWNFHVWNDVWMMRPDLPSGFGGWQAIDATPQETSEGVYCTGPASLEAVKNGLVQLPYDSSFVFSEVNADRIHCIQTEDGAFKRTIQANYIGKNISTKGPNGDERVDITNLYKFPEDSQQERTAVWRAIYTCSSKKNLYEVEAEDMDFEMVHKDDTLVGEPFDVILKIRNKGGLERLVKTTLTATVVHYTGVPVTLIKYESKATKIKEESEEEVKMTVMVSDYMEKVTDMCHIKISSMSQVNETKQFHCDSDDFRLCKPSIDVKVPSEVKLGDECEVEASFTNPLLKTLTRCEFSFEAPSLQRPIKISHEPIPPQGVVHCRAKLTPLKEGEKEIIVGFWSLQLSGVTGSAKIKVTEV